MKNKFPFHNFQAGSRFSQQPVRLGSMLLLLSVILISSYAKSKVNQKQAQATSSAVSEQAGSQEFIEVSGQNKQVPELLYQSADGGDTWQNLSSGLPDNINISRLYSRGSEIFLGTYDGLVYHCFDLHKGQWTRENIGGLFKKDAITGIFGGSAGPYISVDHHGLFKRVPGTGFWQPVAPSVFKDLQIHDFLETPDGHLYIASGAGIYRSDNEGLSWKYVFKSGWASSLIYSEGVLLATATQGIIRSQDGINWTCTLADAGAVYKTGAAKGTFSAMRLAAPWVKSQKNSSWANASDDILLTRSADKGKSWQKVSISGLHTKQLDDFVQAGRYLFCSHRGGISRSDDGGKTWKLIWKQRNDSEMDRMDLIIDGAVMYALHGKGGC